MVDTYTLALTGKNENPLKFFTKFICSSQRAPHSSYQIIAPLEEGHESEFRPPSLCVAFIMHSRQRSEGGGAVADALGGGWCSGGSGEVAITGDSKVAVAGDGKLAVAGGL